jgi:hypothetical protein
VEYDFSREVAKGLYPVVNFCRILFSADGVCLLLDQ